MFIIILYMNISDITHVHISALSVLDLFLNLLFSYYYKVIIIIFILPVI